MTKKETDSQQEKPGLLSLVIPAGLNGKRLDAAVAMLAGESYSRAGVQRLMKEGRITVDGGKVKPSLKAESGQRVIIDPPPPEPVDIIAEPMDLDILFEDSDLIVLNKAPYIVVHPSPGHYTGTLVHGLMHHTGGLSEVGGKLRPGIVHRLDKDTSGALVVAKSDLAHRRLVARFASGRIQKQYLALVKGKPPVRGKVEAGIGRHPVDRKRMSTRAKNPKPAKSDWLVTRAFNAGYSLLRVSIHTGRTHQIRVHLAETGHPVAGDGVYGKNKKPRGPLAGLRFPRQMLHALHLGFTHPITREPLLFTAPLPDDFRAVLRKLEALDHA